MEDEKQQLPTSILTVPFDEDGFAIGWIFAVHKASMQTIGLQVSQYVIKSERLWDENTPLGERKNKNTIIELLTQSNNFSPTKGEVFYDSKRAYDKKLTWGESLKLFSYKISVEETSSDIVTISINEVNSAKTGFKFISTYKLTNQFFALFLQTGILITIDGEVLSPCGCKNTMQGWYDSTKAEQIDLLKKESPPEPIEQVSSIPIPPTIKDAKLDALKIFLREFVDLNPKSKNEALKDISIHISFKMYNDFRFTELGKTVFPPKK